MIRPIEKISRNNSFSWYIIKVFSYIYIYIGICLQLNSTVQYNVHGRNDFSRGKRYTLLLISVN